MLGAWSLQSTLWEQGVKLESLEHLLQLPWREVQVSPRKEIESEWQVGAQSRETLVKRGLSKVTWPCWLVYLGGGGSHMMCSSFVLPTVALVYTPKPCPLQNPGL